MSRVLLACFLVFLLAAPATRARDDKRPSVAKPKADAAKPKLIAPPQVQALAQPREGDVALAQFAKPQRNIYHVKHVPAIDLGNVLEQVLRSDSEAGGGAAVNASTVVIVAEPVTNSLVISGPPQVIEGIVDLIEALDRRPAQVQVRALVAEISTDEADGMLDDLSAATAVQSIDELAAALAEQPGLRVLGRPQLTVLDNQPGFLQLGSRAPRITGSSTTQFGQTHQVTMENVGLILGVTARISSAGLVTMEVNLEKSQLGPEEEGTPIAIRDGKPIRTPVVETLSPTTVGMQSGQTLLLAGVGGKSESRQTELILLISPRIVEPK